MASLEECLSAVEQLAGHLDQASAGGHVGTLPDRVLALELTDLERWIVGGLRGGRLVDLTTPPGEVPDADVTLRCTADTLLALCCGELGFPIAWATGRLSVEAGIRDLIRLRSLL